MSGIYITVCEEKVVRTDDISRRNLPFIFDGGISRVVRDFE